jgi:hypothetical protein
MFIQKMSTYQILCHRISHSDISILVLNPSLQIGMMTRVAETTNKDIINMFYDKL